MNYDNTYMHTCSESFMPFIFNTDGSLIHLNIHLTMQCLFTQTEMRKPDENASE